ncbi:MAG TPA: tRNA (adenosine(37)-N6)-dimethylallyltransferase MiaA [Chitinophagaceae bacterium]|nr:tRNA (adenosine(37)-N6)-dimethylallyltransferase MiaA [Chitinophagaceae bacterium]
MQKTCIIILGPTAVGKTALAIAVAQHFGTNIISADSRQCFRELNIGVAKPSAEDLALVHHYFINSHSIHDHVNAAIFEELSLQWCEDIFRGHDAAVMAGGTGLYIHAFMGGLDAIPAINPGIREEVMALFQQQGVAGLQAAITTEDPLFAASGEMQNPQRLMRALEVKRSTGESILSYRSAQPKNRPFNMLAIGLDVPRSQLYQQIDHRVDEMMRRGLLEEAKALFPFRALNALQTVGYTELFEHLDGSISLPRAVELIKQHTRNYAKRQLTWFRKIPNVHWFSPADITGVIGVCMQQLQKVN